VTCQPPRIVVLQVVRDHSGTGIRQRSAFGRVRHDRDQLRACAEQLQDSVTSDTSGGSENSDSTY
jgi:hypothetical protein